MKLFDAHNHLHQATLMPHHSEIFSELTRLNVQRVVVNGTRQEDWNEVAALAASKSSLVLPSFGLHPWYVPHRSPDWEEQLIAQLDAHPFAALGEIGLDRWIEGYNFPAQLEVFGQQLKLAVERQRPVTMHCLQAFGALWDYVRTHPVPDRGFLLHSYGGPVEMVPGFVERGAWFSFSPSFLQEKKESQRKTFQRIPLNRLLVETDAPDMYPPVERNLHPLEDGEGNTINHPANIEVAYAGLAEIRGMEVEELAEMIERNFRTFFE